MPHYVIGVTGASGAAYALRTAQALLDSGAAVHLVASTAGRRVLQYETGDTPESFAAGRKNVVLEDDGDLFSPIASGSFICAGMAVVPCSMSTLGQLAGGVTPGLLTRAADVMLKQRRPLVLVPRETPLTPIHLRNMLTLAECGAVLLPAMPGFYHHPATVEDLVSFVAGKILDSFGIENDLYQHWKGALEEL